MVNTRATELVETRKRTIVRECADLLDDETTAANRLSAAADTEVGVLPEQAGVLFVDANDVLHADR